MRAQLVQAYAVSSGLILQQASVTHESLVWVHHSKRHGAVLSRYVQAPALTPL